MKISNIPLAALAIVCLGGLVSCYPIQASPATQKRNAEKSAAAAKVKAQADAKAKATKKANETTKKVTKKVVKPITGITGANTGSTDATNNKTVTKKDPVVVKPAIPKVVKFAAPVPGKDGFVFNPYTHNQVDVRGIPSGTKVRDPHDNNPAHIFKVP